MDSVGKKFYSPTSCYRIQQITYLSTQNSLNTINLKYFERIYNEKSIIQTMF